MNELLTSAMVRREALRVLSKSEPVLLRIMREEKIWRALQRRWDPAWDVRAPNRWLRPTSLNPIMLNVRRYTGYSVDGGNP